MKIPLISNLFRSVQKRFDRIVREVRTKKPPEPQPIIKCFLCNRPMRSFLRKTFNNFGLKDVDYVRCPACGLVVSHTHYRMDMGRWETLNQEVHANYQGSDVNPEDANWLPRLRVQAEFLKSLSVRGVVPTTKPWLDWGAGDAKLSARCAELGLRLESYDRFRGDGPGYLNTSMVKPGNFDLVITTSVFEHIRELDTLNQIAGLVSPDGVLVTHTEVRRRIPRDPNWFYLLPPHTTFMTDAAMGLLMRRWGFDFSVLHEAGEVWLFFRGDARRYEQVKKGLAGIPGVRLGNGFVGRRM